MGQIKHAFPLPGKYHFRFKAPLVPGGDRDKDAMAVWMDCIDDRQSVPTWRNSVVAKVTRIGVEDDDDDDEDFHRPHATSAPTPAPQHAPAPAHDHHHRQQQHASANIDLFGGGAPEPASVDHSSGLFGHSAAPPPQQQQQQQQQGDLLGGMHSTGQAQHGDLLGMGMGAPPAPASGGYGGYPQQQQNAPQSGPFF